MFFKKQKKDKLFNGSPAETVISEGIAIESGKIHGTGNVRIDGSFSGDISIDGYVAVGAAGNVSGEIKARSAMFSGTYSGSVTVDDTVRFFDGSNVNAQVEANKIIMDEGAAFKGYITSAKIFQEEAKL